MRKSLLLCLWILTLLFVNTAAASPTIVTVDPQSYIAEAIGVTFQINATVQNVTSLAGYEFKLAYNTTVLTATNITYGGIFGDTYFPLIKVINDAKGWAGFSCFEMFGELGFNGSGVLATITFNTTELGFCTLDLYEIKLQSTAGERIAHDVIDGDVTVIPEFPLAVIAPLFLIVTLAAVILGKIIWSKRRREPFVAT